MNQAFIPPAEPYACCDFFAGKCAISRAFRTRSYPACALDIALDERDETHHENENIIYVLCACIYIYIYYLFIDMENMVW